MTKTIQVKNDNNLPTISWEELKANYKKNTLKEGKNRDVSGLKQSILSLGFFSPLFVWEKGKYVIDGSGRFKALELLEYEGYKIPDLPYLSIRANNLKEAKQHTLAVSSAYGTPSAESMAEFLLDMDGVDLGFVNIEGFNIEEINWMPPKSKEIDMDKMKGKTRMEHTCPNCNHKFTTK